MDNPIFKLEGVVHERSAETLQDLQKRRAAYASGNPLRGYSRYVDVGYRGEAPQSADKDP